jgi:hypothetical protein
MPPSTLPPPPRPVAPSRSAWAVRGVLFLAMVVTLSGTGAFPGLWVLMLVWVFLLTLAEREIRKECAILSAWTETPGWTVAHGATVQPEAGTTHRNTYAFRLPNGREVGGTELARTERPVGEAVTALYHEFEGGVQSRLASSLWWASLRP